MGTQVGALSVKIGADTSSLTKGLQQAVDNIRKFSNDAQAMRGSLRSVESAVSGLQVAFAGLAGITLFREAFTAADRMDAANRKLAATARGLQIDFSALDAVSKQLQATFGLSDPAADALAGQMSKLTSAAGQLNQTLPATAAFLDLAAANSISAAEAGELLNNILSGQDEGLNRLGLANPSGIYAEFAKTLGTTAAKLDDAQKKQAILNAIIEAGKLQVGEYAKFTASAAGQTDKWRAQMEMAAASIGSALEGIRLAVMQGAAGALQILAVHADTLVRLGTVLAGIYVGRVAGAFAAATVQAIRTTVSLIAQTAAIRGVTTAAATATVAVRGLRVGMALLGGPIGILVTVGASLAAMFLDVGGKAKDAAGQARAAAEEFRGALQTMDAATLTARANSNRSALRAIDTQVADLREGVLRDLDKLDQMEAGWAKNSLRGEVQLREGQIKQLEAQKNHILAEHRQVLLEARAREDAKVVVPEIVVPDTKTGKGKTPAQLLDDEINRLAELADLRALTADEQTRMVSLEAELNRQYRAGIPNLERRLEVLQQIEKLSAAMQAGVTDNARGLPGGRASATVMMREDLGRWQSAIDGAKNADVDLSGPEGDGDTRGNGSIMGGGIIAVAAAAGDAVTQAGTAMKHASQSVLASFTPLGLVSTALGGFFEALQPLMAGLMEPIRMVGVLFGEMLAPALKLVFPVIKFVAVGLSYLGTALGWIVRAIGKLIDKIPGISGGPIIRAGQSMMDAAERTRKELQGLTFTDAMERAAEGVKEFGEAVRGLPDFYKLDAARFGAIDPVSPVSSTARSGGVTQDNSVGTLNVTVVSGGAGETGDELLTKIETAVQSRIQRGAPVLLSPVR